MLSPLLSQDELLRSGRFHFEKDRNAFIVRRGILRTILGRYLTVEPGRLTFSYEKKGKPRVADTFGKSAINFNLSLSSDIALYAFTRNYEIGIDVEHIRDIADAHQIVNHNFSLREQTDYHSVPRNKKKEAFFNCWTRKEAFIKAIGEGLSHPLESFDVSLTPGKPAQILSIAGDSEKASQWFIQSLTPAPEYVAAFAVKHHDFQLKCWRWVMQDKF